MAAALRAATSNNWCIPSSSKPCPHHRVCVHRRSSGARYNATKAANKGSVVGSVHEGRFGNWTLTSGDLVEVWGYRVGLTVTAAAILAGSSLVFLPDDPALMPLRTALHDNLNIICLLGAAGLGVSLQLIHIYMAVLKLALQVLWLLGTCGGVYLMLTQGVPAAQYVAENPWATWLVGPIFASLTGVAFKEGLCYGKWDAAGLFGTIPLFMLGHLFSVLGEDGERGMLAAMVVLATVFAARKYTQPVEDDIGDKSVFAYLQSSAAERQQMTRDS